MPTITGLDFPENLTSGSDVRLEWTGSANLQRQPHTAVWKYRPRQQTGYYTTIWHSWDDDGWHASQWEFGTHGHPASDGVVDGNGQRQNGTGSGGTTHYWEIAGLLGNDFFCSPGGPGGTLMVKDLWYTQARQTEIINISGTDYVRHRFWPDIDNAPSLVIEQDYPLSGLTSGAPGMKFTIGGSPWRADAGGSGTNDETPNGVIRHIMLYDAALSFSEIQAKLSRVSDDSVASDSRCWYSNINPIPGDVSDKSGAGHSPSWANANRPILFSQTTADVYGFQGNAFQFGQYISSGGPSPIEGTLDTSFSNFTVSATGKVEVRGTGANNAIANVTASGLGKVEVEGVGANNTIANVTASGLGTVLIQGTGANTTIAAVTSSATGTVLVQGTGANNTIDNFTLAGTGVIGASVSGELDVTIDPVTSTATGSVQVSGTGSNTIAAVTVTATGKVEIQGVGATNTVGAVTAAGLGTVRISGTTDSTIGAVTVSGVGKVEIEGVLASTIAPFTLSALGSIENRGTLDVTIGAVTLTGSGVVGNFVSGQLNQTIGLFTVTATGGIQNTVRSMGATLKQGSFNGSSRAKPYSKSRFRQENMKWPSRG